MKTDIFAIQSTCMEVSVSLSCLFVHEPPYQTTVVCCNAVFRRCSSRMDHRTFSTPVRVGLAQARPNKSVNRESCNLTYNLTTYFIIIQSSCCGLI